MAFEPFLEPWVFVIQKWTLGDDNTIKLTDRLLSKPDKTKKRRRKSNNLNLNISSAFIETAFQVQHIFTQKVIDQHPYSIKNMTGYDLKIKPCCVDKSDMLFRLKNDI